MRWSMRIWNRFVALWSAMHSVAMRISSNVRAVVFCTPVAIRIIWILVLSGELCLIIADAGFSFNAGRKPLQIMANLMGYFGV